MQCYARKVLAKFVDLNQNLISLKNGPEQPRSTLNSHFFREIKSRNAVWSFLDRTEILTSQKRRKSLGLGL